MFVEKLRGYAELTDSDVAVLDAAVATRETVPARHDLIREGDRPEAVLVLLEGWACRYKVLPSGLRQVVAFLMPGDSCDLNVGMLASMDHSIQTLTKAVVARIPRDIVMDLVASHPRIARALYVAQLVNEGILRAWIVSLGRRTSQERVAHLLLELYIRGVRTGLSVDERLEVPLSQIILADALGMTAVHINRTLRDLRLAGAVELRRGMLRIFNPVLLTRISGFDDNYLHRRMRALAGPPKRHELDPV